jgi:hypothetical protein
LKYWTFAADLREKAKQKYYAHERVFSMSRGVIMRFIEEKWSV